MKLRMLSVLSIVVALMIKSMDISAHDYNNFRLLAHAIPSDAPPLLPYPLETELDSIVFQLAQADGIMERFVGETDTTSSIFQAYEKLKLIASEDQLNELMLHDSPIVKVYAYRALVVNQMNMNCDYEQVLISDSTCIDWFSEDLLTNTTVAEMVQKPFFE